MRTLELVLDADRVGDPVGVVEVADHPGRVVDRGVVEAVRVEEVDVGQRDAGRLARQLDGEVAERACAWLEVGGKSSFCWEFT